MSDELLPCPFCGDVPPDDSYYMNQGDKWGGIKCCIDGPEVRTSYKNWPAWKDKAIEAWNTRVPAERAGKAAPRDDRYSKMPLLHLIQLAEKRGLRYLRHGATEAERRIEVTNWLLGMDQAEAHPPAEQQRVCKRCDFPVDDHVRGLCPLKIS